MLIRMSSSTISVAVCATACTALLWKSKYLNAAQPMRKYELQQVQVIFRHGARTPLFVPRYIPSVSYEQGLMNHSAKTQMNYELVSLRGEKVPSSLLDEAYQKEGFLKGGCLPGQLTSIGAEQMYQLGKYLRERYVSQQRFLSPNYTSLKNELYVRSTNVARTVSSARCVLAGLLDEYGTNPLQIHVSSAEEEIMYPNYHSCIALKRMASWAWEDPDKIPGIIEMRKEISESLGLPAGIEVNLAALKDNFVAETAHKKSSLSQMLSSDILKRLDEGAMKIMLSAFVGVEGIRDKSLRLAIGPFVDVLLTQMENLQKREDFSGKRMLLYSGHDTTIIPLLSALGLDCSFWPPYASNIILELYQNTEMRIDEEKYYVKVLFNGVEQRIAGQKSTLCPYSFFIKSLKSVRLSYMKYKHECSENSEKSSHFPGNY